jgi:hypothetical protein
VTTPASPPSSNPNAALPRFLIVAPPKSASTHVAKVVRSYFDIGERPFSNQIDWDAEHNLIPEMLITLRGHGFCFNLHMLPHRMNLSVATQEHIRFIGLWRNLGDMLVSLDDHILLTHENGPMFYIRDHAKYRSLPSDDRHAWLIDAVLPWYLKFYLKWRAVGLVLHPYEQMLLDRRGYFAAALASVLDRAPSDAMLDASVHAPTDKFDRINVGRAGRSAQKLSAANRARLERAMILHPDSAQLEILIWELPWKAEILEPLVPLDGQVVRADDDGTVYFVSRGKRYPVPNASWLLCRVGERRTPRDVPARSLAPYPTGEALD